LRGLSPQSVSNRKGGALKYFHTLEELTDRELGHIARFWLSKETKEDMLESFMVAYERHKPGDTCPLCRDAYEKLTTSHWSIRREEN
jgi:hypothetical protein